MSKPRPRPVVLASHNMRLEADYFRISDDDKGQAGGIDRQRELLDAWPSPPNSRRVGRYPENNVTAANPLVKRPEFEQLLVDVANGKVNVIRVVHFDRLFRQLADLYRLEALAINHGLILTSLQSGTEIDLQNPTAVLQLEIICVTAKHEVARGSQRLYSEQDSRAKKGVPASNQRCFGYLDGDQVVEAEAIFIREGTRDIIAGGSLTSIATKWNRAGSRPITCKCGHPDVVHTPELTKCHGKYWKPTIRECECECFDAAQWTSTTVRQMLLRPRNAGLRQHRGEVVGAGLWDAIVTPAELEAVTAVLSARTKSAGHNARRHLLSSLISCGNSACDRTLRVTSTNGVTYYACKLPAGHVGRAEGRHPSVQTQHADEVVEYAVLQEIRGGGLTPEQEVPPRVAELRTNLAIFRARFKENEQRVYTDPTHTTEAASRVAQGLAKTIGDLSDELAGYLRKPASVAFDGVPVDEVETVWRGLRLDQRRAVISEIFDKLTALPPGAARPGGVRVGLHRRAPE